MLPPARAALALARVPMPPPDDVAAAEAWATAVAEERKAVLSAGGVAAVEIAKRAHPTNAAVQHMANAALMALQTGTL